MQRLVDEEEEVVIAIQLEHRGQQVARESTEPAIVPPADSVNSDIQLSHPYSYKCTLTTGVSHTPGSRRLITLLLDLVIIPRGTLGTFYFVVRGFGIHIHVIYIIAKDLSAQQQAHLY